MSVFPISGPGLALGTSSSKKRSVGAEASGAPGRPVAVPRAGGGCWGAARSRPRKRGCSAPQRTQRRTSLCYARKPRLARGRTRIQPKPIQSTATDRGPPQRDLSRARLRTRDPPLPSPGARRLAEGRPRSVQHGFGFGLGPRPGGGYGCARRTPGHAPRRSPAWGRSAGALGPRIAAAFYLTRRRRLAAPPLPRKHVAAASLSLSTSHGRACPSSFGAASASAPMPAPGRDLRLRCPVCRGPVRDVLACSSAMSPAWGRGGRKSGRAAWEGRACGAMAALQACVGQRGGGGVRGCDIREGEHV